MNTPTNYTPPTGQHPQKQSLAQIIANLGPQSPLAAQSTVDPNSMGAGIKPSFATVSFKGKTWGIRHRGTTTQLLVRDPQTNNVIGAVPSIDVVIIKTASVIGKTYYIERYKEGDFARPDCWSTNGVVPDTAAPHKQNPTCRGCKQDAFGSRKTDDGRNAKACADSKRIAVVPAGDLKNESYGGPMLVKLPQSAFDNLTTMEMELHQQGYQYWGIVTRMGFDFEAAFPRITFTPARVLNDHEMQEVLNLQEHELVNRILSEEVVEVTGDPVQPPPDVPATPAPVSTPPASPVTSPTSEVTQAFVPQPPPVRPATSPPLTQVPTHPVTPSSAGNGLAPAGLAVQATPAPQAESDAERRIRELEAQLADAQKPKTRKRTPPVTPNGPQPSPQAVASPADEGGDDDTGDAPADLESKIDALLKDK